jgi:hypothetical protein
VIGVSLLGESVIRCRCCVSLGIGVKPTNVSVDGVLGSDDVLYRASDVYSKTSYKLQAHIICLIKCVEYVFIHH